MSLRRATAASVCAATLLAPILTSDASASMSRTTAGAERTAWVRRAATNFIGDELAGDGAGVCAILDAPLRFTAHRRTCAQRWDLHLAQMLHEPGTRAKLRAQRRAIARAPVVVHGDSASIQLSSPLLRDPANRFLWTENCWMLEG
jgi:hypothetical protein